MDLKQLKCFIAVAEELHFGRAAQRISVLPSALGRQIRLLEEDTGARLLTRSTRHVSLTEAGASLLRDAYEIVQKVADAERRVRKFSRQTRPVLRLGAIDSAAAGLLPPLLGTFHCRHPEIETHLVECTSAQQLQYLQAGRLDLAFVRPPVHEPGLRYEFLLYDTMVVAIPHDHHLASRERICAADLVREPLIVPPRRVRPHSYKAVMRALRAAGEEPQIVLEASEKQTIISLVAAGIGVALVPGWVAKLQVPGAIYRPFDIDDSTGHPEAALGVAWSEGLRSRPREMFLALVHASLRHGESFPAIGE